MNKILIVDDLEYIRMSTRALLTGNAEIFEAADPMEALNVLDEHPDMALVISDLNMEKPEMDGLDLFRAMNEKGYSAEKWLCSGTLTPEVMREAVELGATEILTKTEVSDALKRHGLRRTKVHV